MAVAMTGNDRVSWLARKRTPSQMPGGPVQLLFAGAFNDRSLRVEPWNEEASDEGARLRVTQSNDPLFLPEEAFGFRLEALGLQDDIQNRNQRGERNKHNNDS